MDMMSCSLGWLLAMLRHKQVEVQCCGGCCLRSLPLLHTTTSFWLPPVNSHVLPTNLHMHETSKARQNARHRRHLASQFVPAAAAAVCPCLSLCQPFLEAQLSTTEGPLFSKAEHASTALLVLVALLPDVVEDVPRAPLLAPELIGQFMGAAGAPHLPGLAELAGAIRDDRSVAAAAACG